MVAETKPKTYTALHVKYSQLSTDVNQNLTASRRTLVCVCVCVCVCPVLGEVGPSVFFYGRPMFLLTLDLYCSACWVS